MVRIFLKKWKLIEIEVLLFTNIVDNVVQVLFEECVQKKQKFLGFHFPIIKNTSCKEENKRNDMGGLPEFGALKR
jgi:hypothetical protein